MSKMFPHLFTPGKIGDILLKNRILKAPQSTGMNNMDGSVSERAIRYYRDQAAGGAGLIIVEYAYIDDIASKSAHCHLGISSDEHISGLAWLAQNIEEMGSVPGVQIEHCGRQRFLGTQPIWGPSETPWPKLWHTVGLQSVPHAMTIEEIDFVVKRFGDAALRAKLAGYKLIEIHGAHGYLLTNFFSPHTNKRGDLYGGSLENRSRIYMEIYQEIRKKVGYDVAVTIRLSGTDYEPDGFPVEDTIALSKALEAEGIDAIHVSGGDHHTMIHQVTPMSLSLCHNTWAAELVKKELHIPVIASGSITMPQYAEDIIASGKGDFVGLGRPLWADPNWPIKAQEDRPEDIRPCIRCNEGCLERTFFRYQAVTCAVNPLISREGELKIQPAAKKRKIAVVGAGAAGMETARVLALRGHDVTLFEASKIKGGLLNESSVPDFKADIRPLTQSLITAIKKTGIAVVEKKAELSDLKDFDAVVCATGSLPANPPIPGSDRKIVCNALDALNNKVSLGKAVVVIGGGLVGSETAIHLAENGKDVTLVEMLPRIMNDVAVTDFLAYSERIAKTNMRVKTSTALMEVLDNGVVVKGNKGTETIDADNVILALGFVSEQGLYNKLIADGKEAYLIGDAIAPGKIMDAIHTAYRVALRL